MDGIQAVTDRLRKKGYRLTSQRLAILNVFYQAHTHLAPQTVYECVKKTARNVTEPTVYRTLRFLTQQGILLCTHAGNGAWSMNSHAAGTIT